VTRTYIIAFLLVLAGFSSRANAQTATINWNSTYQTIDGFGASDAACTSADGFNSCSLTSSQADQLFSPTANGGIGLSILRTEIADNGSCATTCTWSDSTTIAEAIARGAKVLASPWSPPASMKTNGSTTCSGGSGNGAITTGSYAAYATYLKNYAQQFQTTFGTALYALSVQNEPDYCPSYDGALWSGQSIHDFTLNNLGPTFSAAGLTTKIMLPESAASNDLSNLADTTMNDPSAAAYVGIVASHDYASPGTASPVSYTTGNKPLWETEVSDFNGLDATMTSGLAYAVEIHQWMTQANAAAWLFWNYARDTSDNETLIGSSGPLKRFYTLGNFSRFVRPGYVRIDATANPASGVYVSAYKNPANGSFVVVAVNTNGSSQSMTFSLSGFTSPSVTPWLTDANNNLAQQSTVTSNNSFSVTLGASSVVTFVGSAGSATAPPAAPTNLTITGVS
jgi:glucuronoarabinoxylan endo-1,4-beta-xylanase